MSDNKSNYKFETAAEWKARHREGKDAPHGWCRCCDVTPLAIIQYNDKNHYKCPECDPNWLEEVMAGGEDEDEDEEEWCYDCLQHVEDGCLADCCLRKEREEEEEEPETANCYGCLRIYNESEGDGGGYCSDKCYHDTVERRKAMDNKPDSQ